MTERVQPTDLELAALISSKICHDVIGPISAFTPPVPVPLFSSSVPSLIEVVPVKVGP